jgi:hypothetical protein
MHALASLYPFHLILWEFLKGGVDEAAGPASLLLPAALALRRVPHRRARPPSVN